VIANCLSVFLFLSSNALDWDFFQDGKIEKIMFQIKSCPAWTDYDENDVKKKEDQIFQSLNKIAENDIGQIRESVRSLLAVKDQDTSIDAQIFLLNRFLFQVPERSAIDGRLFGGWVGPTIHDGMLNRLWPFSYDSHNNLRLTGSFQGYFGPRYNGLSEFDYFYDKFGLRERQKK